MTTQTKHQHPLRAWRQSQTPNVTLTALAEQVNVTPSHLSEIETGKNAPSLDLAIKLSRITSIQVERFVPESVR